MAEQILISRAVVEQVLEALELMQPEVQIGEGDAAIDALRAALAQQAESDALRSALEKIAGFTMSHFIRPHERMALECVTVARAALAQQAEPAANKPRLPLPGQVAALKAQRDALMEALDRYRGQLDRFGVHSAADAIDAVRGGGND